MKKFSALLFIRDYPVWFFAGLILLISAADLYVSLHIAGLPDAQIVALGITLDLVIGIPTLGYIFFVRLKKASPIILVPLFFASLFLAQSILPTSQQYIIAALYQCIPLIELGVVGYGLLNLSKIIKEYRRLRYNGQEPIEAMDASLALPFSNSLVRAIIITELSVLYFAFGKGRYYTHQNNTPCFSYHRRNGYAALLGVMLFCMGIETTVVHILVQMWLPSLAWILTILSVFGIVWLWGDYSAMKRLPILLTPDAIHFRMGIRWNAIVPRQLISEIRRIPRKEFSGLRQRSPNDALLLTPIGEANIIVVLKHPTVFRGLYGRTKSVQTLFIGVDDERSFLQTLS